MPSSTRRDPLAELHAWQRFHIKLIGFYGGTVFLALMVLAVLFYFSERDARIIALHQRLLALTTTLARSVPAEALDAIPADTTEAGDLHAALADRLRQVATHDPDVESIYILRPTNEPTRLRFFVDYSKVGRTGKPGEAYDARDLPVLLKGFSQPAVEDRPYADTFGTTLSGYAPIVTADGRTVGIVGADVQAGHIARMQRTILYSAATVFGAATLVIGLVSLAVARSVRDPLNRIIRAASAVQQGDLEARLNLDRTDEFGLVGRHFDSMIEGLKERDFLRDTFGRYVSSSVAQMLLAQRDLIALGGEERIVTVLFADLRSYSRVSGSLAPSRVLELLNTYLGEMTAIIEKHHGCVIEFMGDAILAAFGAPFYVADHAERALQCAVAMQRRLKELNRGWQESGLTVLWSAFGIDHLEMGIGLHSGSVIAGNIGSLTRMKYAVIGETVNVAARLEELNKDLGTEILLSGEVFSHLPPAATRQLVAKGDVQVKGSDRPLRVLAVATLCDTPVNHDEPQQSSPA